MRIAVFNWRCFRHAQAGGSELYLHKQAALWVQQGHEVVWITSRPAGTARRETFEGIQFVRMGGTFSIYGWAPLQYFRHARDADVLIDVENGIPFFTPFFSRRPKVLLIHHIHTDVWDREAGRLTARIGKWLEGWLMPRVYRKTPIVTVSESSSSMIDELFGEHAPIQIVYNAISQDLVPGTRAEEPEVIYLGRVRRYKSIDVLLRALSLLEREPALHIVGQGEDEPRLKALAQELGLEKVEFHGFVEDHEKRALLQRSWIAVNPSSMEGWGITNIEANACGVPVLGSDVPGIRDSIAAGVSGELFPYGDAAALAARLDAWIGHPALLEELSVSARGWAARFSWEASADTLCGILKQVISKDR